MEEHAVRINKYLADAGICSRREADRMIEGGRVRIDGVARGAGRRGRARFHRAGGRRAGAHARQKGVYRAEQARGHRVHGGPARKWPTSGIFIGHKERIYPIGRLALRTARA